MKQRLYHRLVARKLFALSMVAGFWAWLGAWSAVFAAAGGANAQDRPRRPNILMVHCHDLGQFLHCYGVKTVQTPNLDRLAAEGVRFSRSFCTNPGCSPSRASLFTGRWPHSNGVMGLSHANFAWDLAPGERHLAQILRDAGYATAAVGVIHETRSGYQRCGYEVYLGQSAAKPATDAAIGLLRKLGGKPQQPFFLCVGFLEPHRLGYPRPTWPGATPGDNSFPGPNLSPDRSLGVEVPGYLRDTEGTRRELAGLQGAVRHMDAQVGRLLAALRESGLESDTLVLFTTDHGIAMPRAKASLYEPGVQVALLLRLPGRKGWHGGTVHTEMVSNIDYLPTILELAGLPVPANVQGRSFAPLLDGKPYQPRREIFTELTYHDYYDPRRAIRTETHKLIVNFTTAAAFMDPSQSWRPQSDTVVPPNRAVASHPDVELYDLTKDPWEQTDLARRPDHAAVRDDLLRRLHRHLVETKDPILQGAVTSPQHRRAVELLEGAHPSGTRTTNYWPAGTEKVRRLPLKVYEDKLRAGWIGQMAGVGWGAPTEFRSKGRIMPADRVPAWRPATVNQFHQDDLYVEMTFLRTLELHGLDVSIRQAGIDFAKSGYPLWHANQAGRDNLRRGIAPPDSGHPQFNRHADDIDYQIEADYSGLIAPGMPQTPIALGEKFGRLMNYGDGLYAGQFIGAMYSEAFFETDMVKIVRAALPCVPPESQFAEMVRDLLAWHEKDPGHWEATWQLVEKKYHADPKYTHGLCSAPGGAGAESIDAKLNAAYVLMGLLYGNRDPEQTILIACRCGQDSDCNPSSAGGVLFTTIGLAKLPGRFTSALNEKTKFSHTPYDFPAVVEVSKKLARQVVVGGGGRVEKDEAGEEVLVIPVAAPKPSRFEPSYRPGPAAGSKFSEEELRQLARPAPPPKASQGT